MKRTLFYLCFAVALGCITLLTTSCSEKTKALNNLEDLAEDVQKNGNTYTISEWLDIFHQYQSITAVIDQHYGDYSQKQRNRINHAKSTIKQAARDKINNSLDLFPGLKQTLIDWYNKLFEGLTGSGESAPAEE